MDNVQNYNSYIKLYDLDYSSGVISTLVFRILEKAKVVPH
jgi:hypothetical protein